MVTKMYALKEKSKEELINKILDLESRNRILKNRIERIECICRELHTY